ncbi:MAG: hypothetical protein GYA24_10370 [Candidatus Lokiarchaeota archaeon]|nr:hypothetical protein [Candidatus Lokiarchaeota archaeon]
MERNANPLAVHRYRHKSRVFLETFSKAGVTSGLAFYIALHAYAAAMLHSAGILPETIYPTLVFDALLGGGCFLLLATCGRGKLGPLVEWLSWMIVNVITVYAWIFFVEYLRFPDPEFPPGDEFAFMFSLPFQYFPVLAVLFITWCGILLFALGYIIASGIGAIASFARRGAQLRPARPSSRVKSSIAFASILAMMLLAPLVTNMVVAEGTVKRTISVVDTNASCNLCVWDLPNFLDAARIGTTTDINVTALSTNQTRILNAFGAMNTTFYASLGISTEVQRNTTIAWLKVLDAFNLTMCWTIWDYSGNFPGPGYPDSWIQTARDVLEFVIASNITNVIGICADSEASVDAPPAAYWANISKYDAFLKEVQANASLAHPDPARGTFETVLCYGYPALEDFVDGDQDLVTWRRDLGLPPGSWTDHHFMLYRLSPADNPSYLHNYLVLAKKYLGTSASVPIVGLTGVDWFAEGYTEGLNSHPRKTMPYHYDGIDGWAAMKREILYPKALGFHQVSVFHLNSYGNPAVIEGYGLLDYYGIDAIEDLAASWNAGLTIEYPISSMQFRIARQGFFNPNAGVIYDLFTNTESIVVLICLLAITIAYPSLKAAAQRLFPASFHVLERWGERPPAER